MKKIIIIMAVIMLGACATFKTKNFCKNKDYAKNMKLKVDDELSRKNTYGALEDILAVKKCFPKDPEVFYYLGMIYFERAEKDKAIDNLHQAITLNPQYPEAHEFLGMILLQDNKPDEALTHFKVAANNDRYRQAYEAWNNMGWIYMQQGKLADAETALKRSLALNPNFCFAHSNLGELRAKQKDYDTAIAEYQKAIQACPALARVHRLLGLEYNRQGKVTEACAEFDLAIKNSTADSDDAKSANGYYQVLNCASKLGQ
jgi:Tfp pilus assembly protein PilF